MKPFALVLLLLFPGCADLRFPDESGEIRRSEIALGSRKPRIVIDPGHGGSNVGSASRSGLREKDVVLDIAKRVKTRFEKNGDFDVFLTRAGDSSMGLTQRREHANEIGADLFLSIHLNGSRDPNTNQVEVYYSSARSERVAEVFRSELNTLLGLEGGIVQQVHWTVLWDNHASFGAILTELMFLSNPASDSYLSDPKNRESIAETLTTAVETVFHSGA
jgi:N-acetylmuramoyl-L-alanine amidase